MGYWWREARVGAAREFGARHYRKFAAVELAGALLGQLPRFVVPLFVLATVAALMWLGWRTDAVGALPLRWIGLGVGAVALLYLLARLRALVLAAWIALLAGAGWLLWFAFTHALGLLLWLAAAGSAVLTLTLLMRRLRRYRLRRSFLDDWID